MDTKIIGNLDILMNRFSKTGRFKNGIYKNLMQSGFKEIRERKIDSDKFVLMVSEGSSKKASNLTIGFDLKKGFVVKQSSNARAMVSWKEVWKNLNKTYKDLDGNVRKMVNLRRTYIQDNLVDSEKNIEFSKQNGDFYKFSGKNGTHKYQSKVGEQSFEFTNKK